MPTYISMLRGINLGSHYSIRMEDLKALYKTLGFSEVRTYVQSGNVVFDAAGSDDIRIAASIEAAIKQTYGFDVSVFLRGARELQRLLDTNPVLRGRSEDPTKLHITFLYTLPDAAKARGLQIPANAGHDEFVVDGREVFVFCPDGYGRTKLSNAFFERKLELPATTRNWNSVGALLNMAGES